LLFIIGIYLFIIDYLVYAVEAVTKDVQIFKEHRAHINSAGNRNIHGNVVQGRNYEKKRLLQKKYG